MARLSMRCPDEMLAAVDAARGDVPREVWLRRAVEWALDGEPLLAMRNAVADRSRPAPADHLREQLDTERDRDAYDKAAARVRSSSQAKSTARPYPKGGKS